ARFSPEASSAPPGVRGRPHPFQQGVPLVRVPPLAVAGAACRRRLRVRDGVRGRSPRPVAVGLRLPLWLGALCAQRITTTSSQYYGRKSADWPLRLWSALFLPICKCRKRRI